MKGSVRTGIRWRLAATTSIAVAGALAAMTLATPVAGAKSKAATKTPPFNVGFAGPLSGPYGAIGQIYVNGLKAEATLLNAAGGVQGHKIEVTALDDAGTPTRAGAAAQQLIQQDHVKFMVPDILDPSILAIVPYTTSAKVLTITGQGAPTVVNAKWPYEFQYDLPYTSYAAAAVSAFKLKHLKVTKVGIIDTTTGSPTAVFAAYNRLQTYGIKIVDTETFAPTATTITPEVAKLQSAGAQVIITATGGTTLTTLFKAIAALNIKLPVLGTVATTTSLNLNTLIPAAQQSQFFATTFSMLSRTGTTLSPQMTKWVKTLTPFGAVTSLLVPCNAADQLKLAVYAYNKAGFAATGAKAAKVLDNIAKVKLPKGYLFAETNPAWTATTHADTTADTTTSWALVNVGKLFDGTYPGQALKLATPKSK